MIQPSSLTHLPSLEPPSETPTRNLSLSSPSKVRKRTMGSNWSRRKSQGAKKSKPQDELLSDTREGDIVVPCVSPSPTLVESCQPLHSVMGTTGSGRSTVGTYRWAISLPRRLR